jgi:hypothetical protein
VISLIRSLIVIRPRYVLLIHTYHSRFISERVAEASQILLRDAHVLPKILSCEEYCRRDRWQAHRRLIAVSGANAKPLVAFYDIRGRKREVLLFYFIPDTARDHTKQYYKIITVSSFLCVSKVSAPLLCLIFQNIY